MKIIAEKLKMPAEWEEHDACWMAWPCRKDAYQGEIDAARKAYSHVAHAISEFEAVKMIVSPANEKKARQYLSHDVEIIIENIDDAWLRDSGPTFVLDANQHLAAIDWLFNAWGQKYTPWNADDAIAQKIIQHLSLERYLAPLVLEGGSIHVDGQGTLMTTEQCLLHPNRNPRLDQEDIEDLLKMYLGVTKIIWLVGDKSDTETDGHVDNIACFASDNRIFFMCNNKDSDHLENRQRIINATNTTQQSFTPIELPCPSIIEKGENLLASYINFYFANGGIVMPSFGINEDDTACAILREHFPNRRVISVPALDIVRGGGGIHCITQQQPKL